jgi:ring-1,2-phenylacetyl-CoA epoxidase subunit PaaC
MAEGGLAPIADLARTLRREERYHTIYGEQWIRRLAGATADSRARVQHALDAVWPEAEALFTPVEGQDRLEEPGVLAVSASGQQARWREGLLPILTEVGLRVPTAPALPIDGRRGAHTEHLPALLEEMTSVWRSDPGARW